MSIESDARHSSVTLHEQEQEITAHGKEPRSDFERERAYAEQEAAQKQIGQHLEQIEQMEDALAQLKGSWVRRLLEFRKMRELEGRLHIARTEKNAAEKNMAQAEELIRSYEQITEEEQKLGVAREVADAGAGELDSGDAERVEELRSRSIREIARAHGCFLAHDIVDADWKPSENNAAIDTESMSWSDQFDVLLGLGPTISASSLREGTLEDGTFGKGSWGVFLSEGRVLGGTPADAGTRAQGLFERTISHTSQEDIRRAIDRKVERSGEKSYNELVIQNPEIAGIYFKWNPEWGELTTEVSLDTVYRDDARRIPLRSFDGWWKKMRSALEKRAPIFVLTPDNRTRMVYDIDPDKKTFRIADADLHANDMTDLPGAYLQHQGIDEKREAVLRQIDKVQHLLPELPEKYAAP